MNGTAHSEDPRVSGLGETLDDCRQFYLDAIARSSGEVRTLNVKKAEYFTAMLGEIRQWQARRHNPAVGATDQATPLAFVAQALGPDWRKTHAGDDFSVLLHRINRIHDELFPTRWPQAPVRAHAQRENAAALAEPDLPAVHSAHQGAER